MKTIKLHIILYFIALSGFFCLQGVLAQDRNIVQVSGLVVGGDSLYGIPGVHIFVPRAGRGTVSNNLGYFSLPSLGGDSLVVRCLGFQPQSFIIPLDATTLSLVIELAEDTTVLPEVVIFPWPTEEIFKEAFLALRLPEDHINNMNKNLNEQVMKRMLYNLEPDGKMNHNYYMQQQVLRTETKYFSPVLALTNPFAWSRFIESVKNGGLKNKKWDDADLDK